MGRERRRHARQPVAFEAVLIRPGLPERRCEIRDFCPAGLFLGLEPDDAGSFAHGIAVRDPVFVEFLPEGGGSRHVLSGYVARLAADGLGVALDDLPRETREALERAAAAAVPQRLGVMPEAQARAIADACRNTLVAGIENTLNDFFGVIGVRLDAAANHTWDIALRSALLNGIQRIARQTIEIRRAYLARIDDGFTRPASDVEPAEAAAELALVDTERFEEWLAVTTIVNSMEEELRARLPEIEQRYATLTGRVMFRKTLPFGPYMVCRAWQAVLEEIRFDPAVLNLATKVFGEALGRRIGGLFERLQEILAPVPYVAQSPKIIRRSERPGMPGQEKASPESPRRGDHGQDEAVAAQLDGSYGVAAGADQEGASRENADYRLDKLLARLAEKIRQGPSDRDVPGGDRATPAGRASNLSAVQVPAASAVHAAGELLMARRKPSAGSPATAAAGGRHADLGELLAALNGISFDRTSGSVQSRVQARVAADAGEPVPLEPPHERTLQTVEALLGRALAENSLSGDLRSLAGRIEASLYKLALTDDAFPANPVHPGRQVLNLLDQFSITADDNGRMSDPRLLQTLNKLVARLADQDVPDVHAYAEVGAQLEELLQPIRQARAERIERLQEACEGRHRLKRIKAQMDEAMNRRLADREIPEIVLRIIRGGWHRHLVLVGMQAGPAGAATQRELEVVDDLLQWLSPGQVPGQSGGADMQALLGRVEGGLRNVVTEREHVNLLLDDLAAALLAKSQGKTGLAEVTVRVALEAERKPDGAGNNPPSAAEPVKDVRVGDWFTFNIKGQALPLQLIWTSQEGDHYAFTNRSVSRKLELARDSLGKLLRGGQAQAVEDIGRPLMERSESLVIQDAFGRIYHEAMHDLATGLLNRKGFLHRLQRLLADDATHVLCLLEFDQFRTISNTCGGDAGESLLRLLSAQMQVLLRKTDLIAYLDEARFGILLANCASAEGGRISEQLMNRLRDFPFRFGDRHYALAVSVGQVEVAGAADGPEELLRHADSACLAARSTGRNSIQVYEAADARLRAQDALQEWAGRVERVIEEGRLSLHVQEIRPIRDDGILLPHYEVLLRLRDHSGAESAPAGFIQAAENLRRMPDVDLWVLQQAFDWIRANRADFEYGGGLSVNLSGQSLGSVKVLDFLLAELGAGDLPVEKITFEITETSAVTGFAAAAEFIRQIRRFGCAFSLDDFGSGFSTYAYLKNLSVDFLKIDGSFVKDILASPTDAAMVKSMNEIAHSLKLRTIAEFVETPEILAALQAIGVDYAQGYAIHRPMPIARLAAALRPEADLMRPRGFGHG